MSNLKNDVDKAQPLSQRPAKQKIILGLLGVVTAGTLTLLGIFKDITYMLTIILLAYLFVGVIELLGGQSLSKMAANWDQLPGWKKFVISTLVIVGFFMAIIFILPLLIKP